MRVAICERCEHYARKKWSHAHTGASGRRVGFTHAYGYCKKAEKRCSEVKACPKFAEENPKLLEEWRQKQ